MLADDRDQLVGGVVGELDAAREAGGQARVGGEERLHLLGVAGDDDDHLVAVVLHQLQQGVHGLPAEVVAGRLARGEGVRLVDEQHTAQGPFEDLAGQLRGVAHVAADEIGAGHLDELAARQHAQGREEFAVEPGDRGLAGARRAGEDEVVAEAGHRESGGLALLGGRDQVDEVGDVPLDRVESDQRVQPAERVVAGVDRVRSVGGGAGRLLADVLRQQQGEVLLGDVGERGQPYRLPVHHLLEHLPRGTAVAETGVLRYPLEVHREGVAGLVGERVLVAHTHALHDLHQLRHRVVLELDGA